MNEIRLSKSCLGTEEKASIENVLNKEYLGMGSEVGKFESELKQYIGTSGDVICVSSGTAALHLAIQSKDIGLGDEVLFPSITYVASPQAISATGANPVPVDININSGFIDLVDAKKRLTKNTKAIMPVHYASDSRSIHEVYTFARENNLHVIEDAAHSFGSEVDGQKVGSFGDMICFSFDGIKNITCGEGGAVISMKRDCSEKIKNARLLGVEGDTEKRLDGKRSWNFDVKKQGWRYHMSNLMAAVGREQLKKADMFFAKKQILVDEYLDKLKDSEKIKILDLDYKNNFSHIFVVRVKNGLRDDLKKFLSKNKIQTGLHYAPCHRLSLYESKYKLINADRFASEALTLPLHFDLEKEDVAFISEKINTFFINET